MSLRDDQVAELLTEEPQTRLVERYTDEAVKFNRESKERPLLLHLAHNAVHTPIHRGTNLAGKSAQDRFGDSGNENMLTLFARNNRSWAIKGALTQLQFNTS